MTQNEAVRMTIEKCGGLATLGQINLNVFDIKECEWHSRTPFASIRCIVRHTPGIYRIKLGLYGLEEHRKDLELKGIIAETEENKGNPDVIKFNHSYYQGIILTIGNLRGLSTFSPPPQSGQEQAFLQ